MYFRTLFVSILILALFLAAIITRLGEILILAVPLLLYLFSSWLSKPHAPMLEATRELSRDRAAQGAEVKVLLQVTNHGGLADEIFVRDLIPGGLQVASGETDTLTSLGPGETMTLTYSVHGQRGYYHFPGIEAIASDHFGLFSRSLFLPLSSRLFILPYVHRLKKVEIRPRHTRIYSGLIPARRGGPGVEFHGVRPYQTGDPLRWINARASARQPDAIYVNEFEQERVADVGLILDARSLSNMPDSKGSLLESSIEAAAALSESLIDSGNRVGLLIYGGPLRWTFPRYGKIQKERILQALAGAALGSNPIFEDLGYIPARLFPAHTQLIIFSPLLEEDLSVLLRLRARGYPIVVVSPDPIDRERRQLGDTGRAALAAQIARLERQFLLKRLRHAGIQVVDWNPDEPFYHVAHHVFSRPPTMTRLQIARPL